MNTTEESNNTINNVFSNLVGQFRANMQTYTILFALVAIWVLFSVFTQGLYLSSQNFSNLFRQMSVTSFLACGMVLVMVTGNIDLSVGKLAGFVSVVVAHFQAYVWNNIFPDQPLVAAILSVIIGLAVGTIVGVMQGYVIAYLRVPAFITTLGGQWIFNGGLLLVTGGKTIPANQPYFSWFGQEYLSKNIGWVVAAVVVGLLFYSMFTGRQRKLRYGFELAPMMLDIMKTSFYAVLVFLYVLVVNKYNGIQIPVLLLVVVAVIMSYVTNNTRFGRYAYAIGGNSEAARLSGIGIRKNIFGIFVLMGFLCGFGGIVLASYVGYGTIAAGGGYELDAIASCVLGGTSTLGGEGTIFGMLIGGLIMASLNTGLQMLNVQPAWQYLIKGLVLILAVYADVSFKKNR